MSKKIVKIGNKENNMFGRICMTLQPQDIICAVTDDPKIKIKFVAKNNAGLKYRE